MRNPRKNELNYLLLRTLKKAVSRDNRCLNTRVIKKNMKKLAERKGVLGVKVSQHDEMVKGAGASMSSSGVFSTFLKLEVYRRRPNGTIAKHYAGVCVWPNGYLDHNAKLVHHAEFATHIEEMPRNRST